MIIVAALALALVPGTTVSAQSSPGGQAELETEMLAVLRAARFDETIDLGPVADACPNLQITYCEVPARPVQHLPNIDLAVIELDAAGNPTRAANVLLSRDYPSGVVVPVDHDRGPAGSYGVSAVRWRRWDQERYDGATFDPGTGRQLTVKGWDDNPAWTDSDDIVPEHQGAPLQFMAPYPASLFKVIVAFRVMRLVDMGQLSLDQPVTWDPTPDVASAPLAGAGAHVPEPEPELHAARSPVGATLSITSNPPIDDSLTRPLTGWLDAMITYSDNDSARALLKVLWDRGDLPAMHAELHGLGLDTLQINGTNPATGGNWLPGEIHMTSMDTARLLWLIDGGSGSLWTRPDGGTVSASILSDSSRAYLKSLLDDQGFHEALSQTNLCRAPDIDPGIPALMSERWIDPADGTVTVEGYKYGRDVRPCNEAAEVIFGHKTGWTYNFGSDAGIVRSLLGKPDRHYMISFIASLGGRYTDPAFASATAHPCDTRLICFTQRIPALARQLDRFLASAP